MSKCCPLCPESGLPPDLRTTPSASSSRPPPSRPRASPRSRASACGPRGARKLAPTRAARAAFSAFPAARLRCKQNGPFSSATKPVMPAWLCNLGAWLTHDAAGLFTFFLFLVGVGQAALFVWQLRLIRKSLGPAEEAARAATGNAQAMIDNERPWIGVDTVYTEKLEPGPVIQQAFVRIKNTGKTPALRMRVAFKGSVLPKGTPPRAPDITSEPPKPLFPDTMDFYYPFGDLVLSHADFQEIVAGSRVAWIVGRIEYFDGSKRPHKTQVCCRWDRREAAGVEKQRLFQLRSALNRLNRRRSHQSGPPITRFHWSRVALMRLACPRRRTLLAPEGHGTFAATGSPRCGWRLSRISALAGR